MPASNTKIVYTLMLSLIALAMVVVAYQRTVNPTHAVTLDSEGIAEEVRSLNEFMTVRYVVQKQIAPQGDQNPDSPMYMVQATVSAAVKLQLLKASDIKVDNGVTEITMPPAGITSTVIDETQTKVWDREVRMWMPRDSFDALVGAGVRRDALVWINLEAEQKGILSAATKQAEEAIRRILTQSGMTQVIFHDGPAPKHQG